MQTELLSYILYAAANTDLISVDFKISLQILFSLFMQQTTQGACELLSYEHFLQPIKAL